MKITRQIKQRTFCSSLRSSFLGNSSSKSWLWVIICTRKFSVNFSLNVPIDTQKAWIYLLDQSFLHFRHNISQYEQRLSFIKTGLLIPTEQRFIPFKFFLFFRIRLASLRLPNLMITFLGPLIFNQWQSSMFEGSIATSNLSKILMVGFSRSSLLTLSGTPAISKHSRLEYWLFLQHCLSNATTRSRSLLFTFFETGNSDSVFLKSLRCWLSFLLILDKVLSNFA